MTDKKLTDNDIIKTLECCISANYICPHTCPMLKNKECFTSSRKNALDLIIRQQVKIDEFMKETAVTTLLDDAVVYTPTLEDYNKFKKKFKSEAYKEFAEKVKEFMHNKFKALDEYEFEYITERDINNLLKEIEGGNNSDE